MPERLATVHVDLEPGWRGGQRQVFLLCTGLAERGHPVTLVARRDGELAKSAAAAGIDVVETGAGAFPVAAVRALLRTIARRRPAVVGLHSSRSHTVGTLARLLSGPGRPLFVVTRRVDFPPSRGFFGRFKYVRGADAYLAISRAVRQALVAAGVPAGRIRLVHSGVEPPVVPPGAREAVRRELGIGTGAPVLGVVAALVDHKGHRYLLEAMPAVLDAFPETVLLVAGAGALREELESQARALGLAGGAVRFLGHRSDIPRLLGALDLFVMPSKLEGLGTAIVDAVLAGVPVVATRAGGIPELIEDGETGLLADVRSPESLARRIVQALADPDLRARLADRARRVARTRFTADAMVEATLAAYRDLLARPSTASTV